MRNIKFLLLKVSLFLATCAFILACSTQKESATNRALQNLSARYNLIYNSNVLLDSYQDNILQNLKNDYDRILPVYYAPFFDANASGSENKELNEISQKAQNIIAEKKFSNYIDEAYILLGKTSFYKGSYFNAYEYFDYVAKTYRDDKNIFLNAINWKARCLMQLEQDKRALLVLDTLRDSLSLVKRYKYEPYATLAQMDIYQENYPNAIANLENAVATTNRTSDRIRWNYILGQLYERTKDYQNSLKYYHKVEKSNAAFEMYFNAKLSKIRIDDLLNGKKSNRQTQLLRLLRDDKNIDFIDQIYFEVAEDYYGDGNLAKAEEYYNLSAHKSTVNTTQKGLAYLRIADLNFKDLSDYVNAKLYYDSAIMVLPKTYPTYGVIVNKAENLQYLTQRYQTIKVEDTLQRIALLPEANRKAALDVFFEPTAAFPSATATVNNGQPQRDIVEGFKPQSNGTFYFANSAATARGFNDFKKRFGNRKLTDNWRQSVKPAAQNTQQANTSDDLVGMPPSNPDEVAPLQNTAASAGSNYLDSLPLTAIQLEKSNQKIILAYFEIASFYQQVLNDKPEAIKIYNTLLSRFPNNNYLDVIYYSLYITYKGIDNVKSEQYKKLVLTKYPTSVYAKTILDPSFSLKQSALEETIQKDYNDLYAKFERKEFNNVIAGVNNTLQRFPGNNLEPQYAYLKSIAIGRTKNVDSLIATFQAIVAKYPTDQLIKPLVEEHLLYINAHLTDFKRRSVALVDFDPNEPRFILAENNIPSKAIEAPKPAVKKEQNTEVDKAKAEAALKLAKELQLKKTADSLVAVKALIAKQQADSTKNALQAIAAIKTADSIKAIIANGKASDSLANARLALAAVKKADSLNTINLVAKRQQDSIILAKQKKDAAQAAANDKLFSKESSNLYFMVIAVNRTDVSLSSSRFGIGQFNRGTYAGSNYRHQLKELDEDQLIYIGDFENYSDTKSYELEINKQLAKIMKVPPVNYTTFVISKENFDKITDRSTLIRYKNFVKANEQ